MNEKTYVVKIWSSQGPIDLHPLSDDEVANVIHLGLRVAFEQQLERLRLFKDEPQRLAYQGAGFGERAERAMWLSLASVEVKEQSLRNRAGLEGS